MERVCLVAVLVFPFRSSRTARLTPFAITAWSRLDAFPFGGGGGGGGGGGRKSHSQASRPQYAVPSLSRGYRQGIIRADYSDNSDSTNKNNHGRGGNNRLVSRSVAPRARLELSGQSGSSGLVSLEWSQRSLSGSHVRPTGGGME